MKSRFITVICLMVAVAMFLVPQLSLAQGIKNAFGEGSPLSTVQERTGYSDEDIGGISGRVINTALTLVGVVFLLLMVYAGYMWMTARGEETKIQKAQEIIKGTVIGLVLVLSAYAITIFVTRGLNPSAGNGICVDNPAAPATGCTPYSCTSFNNSSDCANTVPVGETNACCTWQ